MADSNPEPGMDNEAMFKQQAQQKRQSIQHVSFGIEPVCSSGLLKKNILY